jgi:hypothetical protein
VPTKPFPANLSKLKGLEEVILRLTGYPILIKFNFFCSVGNVVSFFFNAVWDVLPQNVNREQLKFYKEKYKTKPMRANI